MLDGSFVCMYTWTLRRQNFLPKGPGGRNFRRKAKKTPPARKNAETQQTLQHAETCFHEIPPTSRRIPPISRRIPPISCCLFCTELDFEKNATRETKNAANGKKAPFSKKAETSADLDGPGIHIMHNMFNTGSGHNCIHLSIAAAGAVVLLHPQTKTNSEDAFAHGSLK